MKPFLSIVCCLLFFACSAPTKNRNSDAPVQQATSTATMKPRTLPTPKSNQVPQVTDAVITSKTVYYISGPQQSRPPDGEFEAGTRVRVERINGAYLLVTNRKGQTAWVDADSVSREPTTR